MGSVAKGSIRHVVSHAPFVGRYECMKHDRIEPRFRIVRVCECPVPVKFHKFAGNAPRLP